MALLVSCSSENKTGTTAPAEPAARPAIKQPQYETGRTAFQRMFLAARLWAADVKPFRLQSQFTADAPTAEGKAGLWRASFASPSKRAMKMFVWSGLVGPDAPEQGVTFTAGFAAGCSGAVVAVLFSEEHETSSANAQYTKMVLIMISPQRPESQIVMLLYPRRREDFRLPIRLCITAHQESESVFPA